MIYGQELHTNSAMGTRHAGKEISLPIGDGVLSYGAAREGNMGQSVQELILLDNRL